MNFAVGNIQWPIIYRTLVFAFWVITTLSSKKRLLPLPPGPKAYPFDIALDLLQKRSSKYSSRPFMTFAVEMYGYDRLLGFHKNTESFRQQLTDLNYDYRGKWFVDVIYWLRFLPDWIPGMGFKKIASDYRKMLDDVTKIPFDFTVRSMGNCTAKPLFVSGFLKDHPDVEKSLIRYGINSLYDGGADTTVAVLNFFLAMTLFPQVQAKAREEIDRVKGGARLPGFEDRENLPYVESVVKEAFRWHVIVPLGLPNQNRTKKRKAC
ncbi:putative Cytochrome P450 [Seiridium cardinale]